MYTALKRTKRLWNPLCVCDFISSHGDSWWFSVNTVAPKNNKLLFEFQIWNFTSHLKQYHILIFASFVSKFISVTLTTAKQYHGIGTNTCKDSVIGMFASNAIFSNLYVTIVKWYALKLTNIVKLLSCSRSIKVLELDSSCSTSVRRNVELRKHLWPSFSTIEEQTQNLRN